MKIVINNCHGGFGLSPEAETKCWELGMQGIAISVSKYYSSDERKESDLKKWKDYKKNKKKYKGTTLFLTTFSPDEKYVLNARNCNRCDPILIKVVEEMGQKANGQFAELRVIDIPDDVKWEIEEYDGSEWIREVSRTWH